MAKKRLQRHPKTMADGSHHSGAAHASNSADGPRPSLTAVSTTVTAQEALQSTLERLDAIAQEAHTYTQHVKAAAAAAAALDVHPARNGTHKRSREEDGEDGPASLQGSPAVTASTRLDVFAVMSATQYQSLCSIIAALGLQLLPSLEEMLKRVTLAVLTPALSTPEAWETLAVLCTTYRAGTAHALTELLESLLREPGVLLLDAPQLVPAWYAERYVHVAPAAGVATNSATAALGGLLSFAEDQKIREATVESSQLQHLAHLHTNRVTRKLKALATMIAASGGYVSASTLQQVALRHVMEVVEAGMLPCYVSPSESGETDTADALAGSAAFSVLRWRVPAAWHAASVELLETFLLTIRPAVPAQLMLTTAHVLDTIAARLHRGVPVLGVSVADEEKKDMSSVPLPPLPVTHGVGAAVVRLGHVLQLLRHPVVLPPYQPAQLTLEKAKRRVFAVEVDKPQAEPHHAQETPSMPSGALPVETASSLPQPSLANVPTAAATAPVAATSATSATAAEAAPPTTHAAPAVEQPTRKDAPVAAAAPSKPAAVPTPVQRLPQPPAAPVRPTVPAPPGSDEDDDDIPDIVMDD